MNISGKQILIVEDEISLLGLLSHELIQAGFQVLKAEHGEEGLKIAIQKHPDLVLLDLLMPKMDGMTMLKKLRKHDEWGQNVPVIILTNLPGESDALLKEIQQTKPLFYLTKSNWKLEDIISKIKEQFEES